MLPGFEDITAKLSPEEIKTAELMMRGFLGRVGKEKAITNKELIKAFKEVRNEVLTEVRVRKIINYIRNNFLPNLVATSKGYYLSDDDTELKNFEDSLEGRERAIASVRIKVRNYRMKLASDRHQQIKT